jgi:hypothetical protein
MGSIQADEGKKRERRAKWKSSKRMKSFYRPLAVSLTLRLMLPDKVEAEVEAYGERGMLVRRH